MTEQQLRALVREAVARELSGGGRAVPVAEPRAGANPWPLELLRQHASHAVFTIAGAEGGECVIEPGVSCNHCGYCKSYGH